MVRIREFVSTDTKHPNAAANQSVCLTHPRASKTINKDNENLCLTPSLDESFASAARIQIAVTPLRDAYRLIKFIFSLVVSLHPVEEIQTPEERERRAFEGHFFESQILSIF